MAGLILLFAVSARPAAAQSEFITPGDNLEVCGIPRIPSSLAHAVGAYTGVYGLPLAGWDPVNREIWLKGLSSATWISRVATPGATPTLKTQLQVGGVYDVYFQPQAKYFVYNRDAEGDEAFHLYLYDPVTRQTTRLSDGKSRSTEPVWSNAGDRIIYSSGRAQGEGVSLHLVDPFNPKDNRLLVPSTGGYLKAYDWSPDDRLAVFCEFSATDVSILWLVDVTTGGRNLLSSRRGGRGDYYDSPEFAKDGRGVYVVTDRDSDFRRLAYIDLATKKVKYLTTDIKWDVDEFRASPDGKTAAFVSNEEGYSRLYLLNTGTGRWSPVSGLPAGVISDLKWHNNSTDLAFNFSSPRTPNDVYSLHVGTGKVELWARGITDGVEVERFSLPELIRWKGTDGRDIPGFLYNPPAKFTGRRPVIVDIHGGPGEQHRPRFGYDHNYFLNELGIVKIYPNVRGSSGYGKAFLDLDNGRRRGGAVEDVGALLDWVKTRPDLDADRILVQGGSYGGYLALSAAAKFGGRVRGAISDCGITNLASFLERTDGWTRELQRSEFGDERDPELRAFMERIAPLNNVREIKVPLLIIQGKNDPRVPAGESKAIAEAAKKNGTPVWYLSAKDEGHGFVKAPNRNFRLYSMILFTQQRLLR